MKDFAARVVAWQRACGRRDLPWQATRDPYRVWLSEVMLQQTQVATVISYYLRFVDRFPDVAALAAAPIEAVMPLWAGLGYYARARNLHACARRIIAEFGGEFPRSSAQLSTLPGIGRSTAAAIAAFCWNERSAILDGNVKRVLARHDGIELEPGTTLDRTLWTLAEERLPAPAEMPHYTQGLMDIGATICTRGAPRCPACPLRATCIALRSGRVDALPLRRARKPVPLRADYLLVAVHAGTVLLERRPPLGIWGGLLALPQFDSRAGLNAALTRVAPGSCATALAARRHAFTHFTLEFTPCLALLERAVPRVAESGQQWLAWEEIENAALPAPIRSLLLELRRDRAATDGARQRGSIQVSGDSKPTRKATRKRETML